MITVDIVIPYRYFRIRKIPFFKSSFIDAISNSDWYPLIINLKKFKEDGIRFRFHSIEHLGSLKYSDCIFIDSGIKDGKKVKWDDVQRLIRKFKREGRKVILFDTKDSHNILMNLLPEVDYYLKKQLLKNWDLYEHEISGGRLFTDFYHQERNGSSWEPLQNNPSPFRNIFIENRHKLKISWNILLSLDKFKSFKDIYNFIPGKSVKIPFIDPNRTRKIVLNANFTTNYKNELIALQRVYLKDFLENNGLISGDSIGFVPKGKYLSNLKNSKAVVSPFGWGEVCYRDFEAFIYGAALIKPTMEHLDTWPDMYVANNSYIPISWDKSKWYNEFQTIINDHNLLQNVAQNGQEMYKTLWSEEGQNEFCNRFCSIINQILD